jgi:hypothetical protein
MKLTTAERMLIGQIVNIKLNSATLREHIRLEAIFKEAKVDEVKLPFPQDFVSDEQKELFDKYNNMRVDEIKDEKDQIVIKEAIIKSNQEREKVWTNTDGNDMNINLTNEDIDILKGFFNSDQRKFPKDYHTAILSLHKKLEDKKSKK